MDKVMYRLIAFILILTSLSCGEKTIYREYKKIENNNWTFKNKELVFKTNLQESPDQYDIIVLLRHATFYPYDHLNINFTMDSPGGERRTKEHHIIVKKDGQFTGDGLGDYWDIEYKVMKNITIKESGDYTFYIDNLMKKYDNPGIMEIGLSIRKSKSIE